MSEILTFVQKESFFKRWTQKLFLNISFFLLIVFLGLLLLFDTDLYIIIICGIILTIYFYITFRESINYLTKIELDKELLRLTYSKYNREFVVQMKMSNVKTKIFSSTKGFSHSTRLVIFDSNKTKYTQYSVGSWNHEKFIETNKILNVL